MRIVNARVYTMEETGPLHPIEQGFVDVWEGRIAAVGSMAEAGQALEGDEILTRRGLGSCLALSMPIPIWACGRTALASRGTTGTRTPIPQLPSCGRSTRSTRLIAALKRHGWRGDDGRHPARAAPIPSAANWPPSKPMAAGWTTWC